MTLWSLVHTVAITLDTYSHAIPAMHEEAAALIARLDCVGNSAPTGGEVGTLLWKALSNSRRNLPIRHLVSCLNADDASTEVVSFKTVFQFALCLTGTEYQN